MKQYEYDISSISAREVRQRVSATPTAFEPRVLYCDEGGECFFDQTPNPYMDALVGLLNDRGREGWMLVQVVLREQDMICFWRQEK